MKWQMQEAKARLSEVINNAQSEGPQHITVRGVATAVVLSEVDYERLVDGGESLVEFMRRSPLIGQDDLEFPRDGTLTREVEL